MPAIASATVAYVAQPSSVTYCGGASSISPAASRGERLVGPEPLQLVGLGAVGDRRRRPRPAPTKNHVANRFGEISGVVQFERCTSASASTSTPASSFASRTAARARGRGEIVGRRRRSRRDRCDRRGTPTRRRGTPASTTASRAAPRGRRSPSRSSTTVAAGAALDAASRVRDARRARRSLNPAVRRRGHPSRGGRAAPSCRTCRRSSSAPRR